MARRRKSPWILPASMLVAVAVSVALLALISRGSRSSRAPEAKREAPPAAESPAAKAERPKGPLQTLDNEAELTRALEETFIALNRDDEDGLQRGRTAVAEARKELPGPVGVALEMLIDKAQRARASSSAGQDFLDAEGELNARFEASGLAYVADVDLLEGAEQRVTLFSLYRVSNEVEYSTPTASARVRHVERVDALAWQRRLAGFAVDGAADALLFSSEIQAETLNILAARQTGPRPILRPETIAQLPPELRKRLERAARAAIDSELASRTEPALSAAIARRDQLFQSWSDRLASAGMSLKKPTGTRSPPELLDQLSNLVPAPELRELKEIEDRLGGEHSVAIEGLRERLARDLERHEAQHILDRERENSWTVPPALAPFGPEEGAEVDPRSMTGRALAEVSGYLAQMTSPDAMVRTNMTYLLRYLLDPEFTGAERVSAALIFSELTARLTPEAPRLRSASPESADVVAAYEALTAVEPERVGEAAREVWAAVFATEMPAARRQP